MSSALQPANAIQLKCPASYNYDALIRMDPGKFSLRDTQSRFRHVDEFLGTQIGKIRQIMQAPGLDGIGAESGIRTHMAPLLAAGTFNLVMVNQQLLADNDLFDKCPALERKWVVSKEGVNGTLTSMRGTHGRIDWEIEDHRKIYCSHYDTIERNLSGYRTAQRTLLLEIWNALLSLYTDDEMREMTREEKTLWDVSPYSSIATSTSVRVNVAAPEETNVMVSIVNVVVTVINSFFSNNNDRR